MCIFFCTFVRDLGKRLTGKLIMGIRNRCKCTPIEQNSKQINKS